MRRNSLEDQPELTVQDGLTGSSVAATVGEAPGIPKVAAQLTRNAAANIARLAVTSVVALALPAYLTHKLSSETYSAWVLILQLSAYVAYLDFGVQTAVSKYVAEYEVQKDYAGCSRCVSVGLVIMLSASVLGIVATVLLAWSVPELFKNMPASLYREVRISVLLVGISLATNLASSVFSAIFLGLQRYRIPMVTGVASKLLYATVLIIAVRLQSSLITMASMVALVNVVTSLLQIAMWKRFANHIPVSLRTVERKMLKQMLAYCGVLTVWSVCMLFITGVDLTIVAHYDFKEVAFYSIATSPTTFILVMIGALMSPLLPATSALSMERSPQQMGAILLKATRYSTILLLLSGLPILVGGYYILQHWVGHYYSQHSVTFLRILLLANITRSLCSPYATMVVATARQRVATVAAISEAVVNVVASILLARHFGAIGVALGTLIGAIAGLILHFWVSMRFTRNLQLLRRDLFLGGILGPAAMAIPSVILLPYWWKIGPPTMRPAIWFAWAMSSLLLLWFGSATLSDRRAALQFLAARFKVVSRRY